MSIANAKQWHAHMTKTTILNVHVEVTETTY